MCVCVRVCVCGLAHWCVIQCVLTYAVSLSLWYPGSSPPARQQRSMPRKNWRSSLLLLHRSCRGQKWQWRCQRYGQRHAMLHVRRQRKRAQIHKHPAASPCATKDDGGEREASLCVCVCVRTCARACDCRCVTRNRNIIYIKKGALMFVLFMHALLSLSLPSHALLRLWLVASVARCRCAAKVTQCVSFVMVLTVLLRQ